jgi:alkyl hydroperoxide reductase subunit AhpF
MSGLFAAGDVTNVPHKQIIIAAGQGSAAALSAVQYINRLET